MIEINERYLTHVAMIGQCVFSLLFGVHTFRVYSFCQQIILDMDLSTYIIFLFTKVGIYYFYISFVIIIIDKNVSILFYIVHKIFKNYI